MCNSQDIEIWRQPEWPSMEKWIKSMTHTHTPLYKQKGVLISHKNEGNSAIRDKMDGP